jgi:hypothetical protein
MACIRPPLLQRIGPSAHVLRLRRVKKQILHFYPVLTMIIEAPFGFNVKIFLALPRLRLSYLLRRFAFFKRFSSARLYSTLDA